MNILKKIKLYAMFKDVRAMVIAQKGQAGWWYSRKFIGAVIVFLSTVAMYLTGITINADMLDTLSNNISNLLSAIVGIYGFVMFMISLFKKKAVT